MSSLHPDQERGGEALSPTTLGLLEVWETLSDFEIEDVAGGGGVENADSARRRESEQRREEEEGESQRQAVESSANGATKGSSTKVIDKRSPLERFRKAPRKNLSVTDLVSPAWCELQYWYSLTKHGRKRATPAMKKGSAVHKTLEEQVHTTVPVEILTREDGWAVRIFNVIQSLHTLRKTGITRELEVWGVIDGEIVTGIIDELSYDCPDPELEATSNPDCAQVRSAVSLIPEENVSVSDSANPVTEGDKEVTDSISITGTVGSTQLDTEEKIYITDIKTRGSTTKAPTVSSIGFRPTLLQLHLYYHMLARLITSDDITIESIASRYRLDTNRVLSDSLIAQLSTCFESNIAEEPSSSPIDQESINALFNQPSLSSLWSLMKQHLQHTFLPPSQTTQPTTGISPPTLLSPLLTATYVSSAPDPSEPMKCLGSRSFFFDANDLYPYLADGMRFWRGNRAAKGVGMVEAWKCRICEFRDDCEWRGAKEKEVVQRSKRGGKAKGKG
ncbi:predicted protein [Uncinocarpus reesii 1704]|uniref:Exonuclease V n=1 Tax=Uncinocarpus reesii (strain UAMH 1704) TaxID=336963 RepID=C4JYG5_UNCRE|nr:uncharacterized protein UREG_07216 [Uncinocarpus reesii 1704]EEP82351.1 predicted protein [Uncinocarpus reesii 1704]